MIIIGKIFLSIILLGVFYALFIHDGSGDSGME